MRSSRGGASATGSCRLQWWRHLRDWKRTFWERERQAARRDAAEQVPMPATVARIVGKID
jgi:hypothetical protein